MSEKHFQSSELKEFFVFISYENFIKGFPFSNKGKRRKLYLQKNMLLLFIFSFFFFNLLTRCKTLVYYIYDEPCTCKSIFKEPYSIQGSLYCCIQSGKYISNLIRLA
jgi:hypothetical protein